MITIFTAMLATLAFQIPGKQYPEYTFDRLTRDLANLDWLADLPSEDERCIQFSSYDRASGKGKSDPNAWYANGDAGQFLREEKNDGGTEWVMVDVEGPGAAVRIWSANANDAGDLKFYFDGEKTAGFVIPFADLTSGKKAPFLEPICGLRGSGWNCHVPFPFSKHLKITATKHDFYYHVNVRLFDKDTRVPTFRKEILQCAALAETQAKLAAPPAAPDGVPLRAGNMIIDPRSKSELPFEDRTMVRWMRFEPAFGARRDLLRSTRIQMICAGSETPEVDVPFGDFFGTAPDFTKYRTFPMGVDGPGGWCRFPIPFEPGSAIRIVNDSREPISIKYSIAAETVLRLPALRFHAKYHQEVHLKTIPRSDFIIINAAGPGRFVGTSLSVRNPVRAWWGEGDEHAYVDGESFPSTFGTGTEDFFSYAWCDPRVFQGAFHSQSRCDGPGNRGFTSVNRFEIGESIPFHHKLLFDLEVWHWANTEVDYASVGYWYAPAGAVDSMPPMPPAAARVPRDMPATVKKFADGLEGESFINIAKVSAGKIETQDLSGFGEAWSRDEQMWWTRAKPGAKLEIPFELNEEGAYALRAQLTKSRRLWNCTILRRRRENRRAVRRLQ
ncbi:MAG: DUF2961 domain-containing protein [Planctomycetes bacterium]|nr:DUF2961 domain-containing protein [Planctomycetota bacterium]